MNPDSEKLERVIAMAERLSKALEGDIDALRAGKPQQMTSLDPEMERLTVLYMREVSGLDPNRTKAAPMDLRKRLMAVTGKFRDTLKLHQRLLTRMRNASEGLVKAVANEVERQRAPKITYAPTAAHHYRKPAVAMIYNGVV
ncbi:MAG: hypothetical protein P4L57_02735 [Rhizomicrobium sp.]|nr:hypothetical protein [Rhizomicrobium sp.]